MTTEKALNLGELADATGFNRAQLRRMGLTQESLPGGKIFLSEFLKIRQKLISKGFVRLAKKVADASPALRADVRTLADEIQRRAA